VAKWDKIWHLHLEYVGSRLHTDSTTHLPNCTAWHPRRLQFTTIVNRFICVTLRLIFLMTFHLEFQRVALSHGKFHKSLLTPLQVISQLFEILLSFRCGLSRTVFIISNISIFCEEICPDLAQKASMIVQKDKLRHLILVYSTSIYNPVNKTNLKHYFILSIFRQSNSTYFGLIYSPSSGDTPYVYNNWYLLSILVDCLFSWLFGNHTGQQTVRINSASAFLYTNILKCTVNKI